MMEPRIKQLIDAEDQALDVYKAFILLWMAAPGGSLNRAALTYLYQHHEQLPAALDRADKLLSIIADDDLSSFLLACRELQHQLGAAEAVTLLHYAIATACADGTLSLAANHTLRFLADLLNLELAPAYREQTGRILPEPGDPGAPDWWREQDTRSDQKTAGLEVPAGLPANRREALAVLGLAADAADLAIKQAYRRLVQNHHPDRVAGSDRACREAAEKRFLQVQQAYDLLRK